MQEVSVTIMSAEANGKGFVLEHLYDICKNVEYAKLGEIYRQLPKTAYDARSFFFHLIKVFVAHDASLRSRIDKTEMLFGTLCRNSKVITDLVVIGKIDNLDFSNVTFQKCHFIDLVLSDCTANQNTRFEECVFRGDLEFVNCANKDWASVKLCDTILYPPSNLVWEKFSGIEIGSKEDHVKDAMRIGLSKFWRNGRLKSGIRKSNWTTGSLGHSIYCKSLLDAMLQTGLMVEEHISGVVGGGYIFDRESIRDLQRFMDSRQPTGKVRQVYEKLMKA